MNFLKTLPLGTRIILVVVLLLALISAGNLLLINRSTDELIEETSSKRIQDETQILTTRLREIETDVTNAAQFLATRPLTAPAIQSGNEIELQIGMLSAIAPLQVDDTDVTDAEGNRLFALLDNDEGEFFEDESEDFMVQQSLLGINVTLLVARQTEDGYELLLAASTPVRTTRGEIVGTITVGRVIDDEFLEQVNFGRGGVNLGLYFDGQLVAQDSETDTLSIANIQLDETKLQQVLSEERTLTEDIQVDRAGIPHAVAYFPFYIDGKVEGVGVVEINLADIDEFHATVRRDSLASIGILGLIGILLFIVTIRWSVSLPIRKLQTATEQIAGGDYSQRAPVTSRDQMGQLAQTFNMMAEAIQQRDGQLSDLNASLEKRIAERTAELEDSNRQLREASRLKSEFLATMSHELRTPLNAVIGYSSLLRMGIGGQIDDEAREKITSIEHSSNHLLGLITEILDIAKIEAGRMEIAHVPMPIQPVVMAWRESLSALTVHKNITFDLSLDPNFPPAIHGDSERLKQIGLNLISNAVKFTEKGQVSVRVQASQNWWTLEVQDTGIGIPPHALGYIFDEFRQVDGTYKRAYGGTGLGLAIVRRLVEAMDGKVWATSKLGEGSIFTVQLPLVVDAVANAGD